VIPIQVKLTQYAVAVEDLDQLLDNLHDFSINNGSDTDTGSETGNFPFKQKDPQLLLRNKLTRTL